MQYSWLVTGALGHDDTVQKTLEYRSIIIGPLSDLGLSAVLTALSAEIAKQFPEEKQTVKDAVGLQLNLTAITYP